MKVFDFNYINLLFIDIYKRENSIKIKQMSEFMPNLTIDKGTEHLFKTIFAL